MQEGKYLNNIWYFFKISFHFQAFSRATFPFKCRKAKKSKKVTPHGDTEFRKLVGTRKLNLFTEKRLGVEGVNTVCKGFPTPLFKVPIP